MAFSLYLLQRLGYRRNYIRWRMPEWELNQLKHCILFEKGIDCTTQMEKKIRNEQWQRILADAGRS